jgi:hypothetical protein
MTQQDAQVTVADLERQIGQMVVQLMTAQKVIEGLSKELADLKADKGNADGDAASTG